MSTELQNKISLEYLKAHENNIHVVGITSYRTATVKNIIFECKRYEFSFLENRIKNKDNHVVLIFQVVFGKFPGTYYAFLTDFYCLVASEIVYESF